MDKDIQIKRSICHWCHDKCPVELHIRNGWLERQIEDSRHPNAEMIRRRVRACSRARHAAEWYYHQNRTKFPLKRKGEKGEGKWQEISWEQALDEIAEKLKEIKERYGPEAVAHSAGTGRTDEAYCWRLFNLFGSPNICGADTICFGPYRMVGGLVFGWPTSRNSMDKDTKLIMLVGSNQEQSILSAWLMMLDLIKAGTKLIVVDPRKTAQAEKADIWLQVRPGTDTVLLMSIINIIIEEDLYDKDFVNKWCYGFDKLRERARDYPAEKVAEITWVPPEKIRAAARMFATIKPAVIDSAMGIEQSPNSIEAIHCVHILAAITGNVDKFGSNDLRGHHDLYISDYEINLHEVVSPEQKAKQLGSDRFKLLAFPGFDLVMKNMKKRLGADHTCLAHAPTVYRAMVTGQPYPVRAMLTVASNPMVTMPNTKLIYKALKSLDLYVVSDYWMTPSAELADYVLPAATWLERPIVFTGWDTARAIMIGEEVMPPKVEGKWDRRNDYDFWRGLAIRLGFGEYFPWETLEEAFNYRLKAFGKTLKQFVAEGGLIIIPRVEKRYETMGFGTPTGKVELYSTVLEQLGYDPLPRYYEPAESLISTPELAKEYPLILITGHRHLPFFHSEHRQVDSIRKEHPDPITQINPKTASDLGISDGDWVWIETLRGRVRQKCQYFEGIDPRVVASEHGWWFPELPGEEPWLHGVWEANINVVVDDNPDHCNPINGGWPARAMLCKAYKVKRY